MKTTNQTNKTIGLLLILGVVLVLVPYTLLTISFGYPNILRNDAGEVLTRFHQGGAGLIAQWWLFGIGGLPLLVAFVQIGQTIDNRFPSFRWVTTIGVLSVIVQVIGLLRWTFVVPVLARTYVEADNLATRAAAKVVFSAIHQYGGVVLGEHLGQLFTIIWTVAMVYGFDQIRLNARWVTALGYGASAIYLLAQGDLFATVIPGFPVWELAGLLGSTLWLIWLLVVGIAFLRRQPVNESVPAGEPVY